MGICLGILCFLFACKGGIKVSFLLAGIFLRMEGEIEKKQENARGEGGRPSENGECAFRHTLFYMGIVMNSICVLCGGDAGESKGYDGGGSSSSITHPVGDKDKAANKRRLHCKECYVDFCSMCVWSLRERGLGFQHYLVENGLRKTYLADSACSLYVSTADRETIKNANSKPEEKKSERYKTAKLREGVYHANQVLTFCLVCE